MSSPNTKAKHAWRAKKSVETKKLNSSSGWSLPGLQASSIGRTRGHTAKLTINIAANESYETNDAATTVTATHHAPTTEVVTCDSGDSPSTLTASYSSGRGNPAEKSRVIVECRQLINMLERHVLCPHCQSAVVASLPTCCLATNI